MQFDANVCSIAHHLVLKLGKWVKPLRGAIRQWMVGANCLGICGLHHAGSPGQGCLAKSIGGRCTARHEVELDAFLRQKRASRWGKIPQGRYQTRTYLPIYLLSSPLKIYKWHCLMQCRRFLLAPPVGVAWSLIWAQHKCLCTRIYHLVCYLHPHNI